MTERRLSLWLVFFLLIGSIAYGKTFEPLTILLPGGFKGELVKTDKYLKRSPSWAWNIPDVVNGIREMGPVLIFSTGDISNPFSPLSFMLRGKGERDLIAKCSPDAVAASPLDLEILRPDRPGSHVKNLIVTNVEAFMKPLPFIPYVEKDHEGKRIRFFNFIDPSACRHLFLHTWTDSAVEDCIRTMYRLNIDFSENDISLVSVYGDVSAVKRLTEFFKLRRGIHLIIHFPNPGSPQVYSSLTPKREGNVFLMSVENGCSKLPMVKLHFKTAGFPRIEMKMLPMDKWDPTAGKKLYEDFEKDIHDEFFRPLRVIPVSKQASTESMCFGKEALARAMCEELGSDLALTFYGPDGFLPENVITVGGLLNSIKNDRIFELHVYGEELKQIVSDVTYEAGTVMPAWWGCSFTRRADNSFGLSIRKSLVDPRREYVLTVPERTVKHSETLLRFFKEKRPLFSGLYMWDMWTTRLKNYKITDRELFD